jgi:hypothetical protein
MYRRLGNNMLLHEVGSISFSVFYISVLGTMLSPEDEAVIDVMLKCVLGRIYRVQTNTEYHICPLVCSLIPCCS